MNKVVLGICFAVVVSIHDRLASASAESVGKQEKTEMFCSKVSVIAAWVKESLLKQKFEDIEEDINDQCVRIKGEIASEIGWSDEVTDKNTIEGMTVEVCIDVKQVNVVATYIKKIVKRTTEKFMDKSYYNGWVGSRKTMEVKKDEVYHQKLTYEVTKDDICFLFSGLKEINTFAHGTSMCKKFPKSYQNIGYNPTPEQVAEFYHQ